MSRPHPESVRPDRENPYTRLVGAVLRQAVQDAANAARAVQDRRDGNPLRPTYQEAAQAEAFLRDREALATWVELVDAEVERIQRALLKAAGLKV